MRRSEIFENFSKIAQDKGLVSSDKSFKKLEETSRADSLSIKDIEVLYNVKPSTPESMEYKKNIMEIAHPNSVVVSPAYDRLNGLVENNIERQNILLNIVNKPNDGLLVQRKYAHRDLLLSLVKIANDLDNKEKEELRVLADSCLKQASLKKEAFWIPVILIASAVGSLYLYEHIDDFEQDISITHRNLIEKIDDLLDSQVEWGFGIAVKENFKVLLVQLKDQLEKFYALYDYIKPLIFNALSPRIVSDIKNNNYAPSPENKQFVPAMQEINKLSQSQQGDVLITAYKRLKSIFITMKDYILNMQKRLINPAFQKLVTEEAGGVQEFLEKIKMYGGSGLISNKFDALAQAIPAYISSVDKGLALLQEADRVEKESLRKLQMSQSEIEQTPNFESLDQTSPSYNPQAAAQPAPQAAPQAPNSGYMSAPAIIR